jgi:Ca-activated chloride channel family protein
VVAELAALAVIVVVAAAETLHAVRVRRVARLTFGPRRHPRHWARLAPLVRVAALGAMTWGLVTLMLLTPKTRDIEVVPEEEIRHLLLVLDVSPSMRLEDAGPTGKQSRMKRAADLMESLFQRVAADRFRVSIVAVYNGAKPVVEQTTDLEVVRNVLGDLPLNYAFESGETRLFDGLEEAARIARPWRPKSTTLQMPASVSHSLVVGVGDPRKGSFIEGRQSRQDAPTLRQIAVRLGGSYHNGNEKHIPTDTLRTITAGTVPSRFERLTRREYALMACAVGGFLYALLPVLLHTWGTGWRPGVAVARVSKTSRPRELVEAG